MKIKWSAIIFVAFLLTLPLFMLAAQNLIWDEDFSDNSNKWFEDSSVRVSGGRYVFHNTKSDSSSWRTTPLTNGTVQTDSTWLGSNDSQGYGIVFRLVDSSHFYFFWLAAKGYYIAGKVNGSSVSTFFSWTESKATRIQ